MQCWHGVVQILAQLGDAHLLWDLSINVTVACGLCNIRYPCSTMKNALTNDGETKDGMGWGAA